MLLVDSIEPEKWYSVRDTARVLGWSYDVVGDWIERGHLQAFVMSWQGDRRKRKYRGKRVQGCEIIRFIRAHLTSVKPGKPRFRAA